MVGPRILEYNVEISERIRLLAWAYVAAHSINKLVRGNKLTPRKQNITKPSTHFFNRTFLELKITRSKNFCGAKWIVVDDGCITWDIPVLFVNALFYHKNFAVYRIRERFAHKHMESRYWILLRPRRICFPHSRARR